MRDPQILEQVKSTLALLTSKAPGRGDGPTHTRGTPPNTIEMNADTWLALASGKLSWSDAMQSGAIAASGVRADLTEYLPLGLDA
jgi:hypothetical protein